MKNLIQPLASSIANRIPTISGRARNVYSQEQTEPEMFSAFLEQQQHEGSTNEPPNNEPPNNEPPGNQPPANQPVDPWANVDLDLLPADVRAGIEKGRAELQRLQSEAVAGRKFQSQVDQVTAENARLKALVEGRQQQQQPPQNGNPKEPETFEDRMRAHYQKLGIPDAQVDAMLKLNAPLFNMFREQMEQQLGGNMAPFARLAVDQHTNTAFQAATQADQRSGRPTWTSDPGIQQKVWEKATEISSQGQIVSPEMLANLGKIFYVDAMANGTITTPNNLPNTNQPIPNMSHLPFHQQPPPMPPQGGSFTFPGAGNFPQLPTGNRPAASPLDPETDAAVRAVRNHWGIQPKGGWK